MIISKSAPNIFYTKLLIILGFIIRVIAIIIKREGEIDGDSKRMA